VIRYLWDENTSHDVLRALRQLVPSVDVLVAQEAGMSGTPDDRVIEVAIREDRVVVTRDRNTLVGTAVRLIGLGKTLPGVIVVGSRLSPGRAAEELALVAHAATPAELTNRVVFLPLS
jgi:hypothetical protein